MVWELKKKKRQKLKMREDAMDDPEIRVDRVGSRGRKVSRANKAMDVLVWSTRHNILR